ncbi:MAG TPA: GNAT family protein [Victivallales bacterium]|nr:GNAT family protein [Victivallales bacterium]
MKINKEVFSNFPVLKSERLILRAFERSDLEFIYHIRSDEFIAKAAGLELHKSLEDSEELLNKVLDSYSTETGINWIICLKGCNTPIGSAGILRIVSEHFKGEIGYSQKTEYCGNGYMSEALTQIFDFGFNTLGLHRLEATVAPHNKNSIKILKKMKFQQEGYFREDYYSSGKFFDSIIFSLLQNDYK